MDLEQLGNPELSYRDGFYWIMDGQHRLLALRRWLGEEAWLLQEMDCWVTTGLTEEDEAEIFLRLNNVLPVNTFEKFRVSIKAGRPLETAIKAIVEGVGLVVSYTNKNGGVRCVGKLKIVYKRDGGECLARALRIARDAFGDNGLDANVIDGLGMLCHRYEGVLDEEGAIKSLSSVHGGVNGLLGAAEQLRNKTGNQKAYCVAAAAADIINRDLRGSKRLPGWWKD